MQMHSQGYPDRPTPPDHAMNKQTYEELIKTLNQHQLPQSKSEWTNIVINRTWQQFELSDDLLYKISEDNKLLVIPEGKVHEIIKLVHDRSHLGQHNTTYLIQQNYWWPGMIKDIEQFVRTCDKCQKQKQD